MGNTNKLPRLALMLMLGAGGPGLTMTAAAQSGGGTLDEIVVTALDHHANFVPWQQLALEKHAKLRVCELTADGRLDLDCLRVERRCQIL